MNRGLKKDATLDETRTFESWQSIRSHVYGTGIVILNHEMPLNPSNIQALFSNGIFSARTNSRIDEGRSWAFRPRLSSDQGHERVIGIFIKKFRAFSIDSNHVSYFGKDFNLKSKFVELLLIQQIHERWILLATFPWT
jgi:hypothetical protein